MTTQDKYTRTAMNWLMAKACDDTCFVNEVADSADKTKNWGFVYCDNTDLESWLKDAAQIIKEYYDENPDEVKA